MCYSLVKALRSDRPAHADLSVEFHVAEQASRAAAASSGTTRAEKREASAEGETSAGSPSLAPVAKPGGTT
jgi:hypothetical protein